MKILVTSDIHSDETSLRNILKFEKGIDAILHGGDQETIRDYGIPMYSIHGNHEDFNLLARIEQGTLRVPNFHLLRSGIPYEIRKNGESITVLGLGGNFSDRYSLMKREEIPNHRRRHFSSDEVEACKRAENIDIFISHEASIAILPRGKKIIDEVIESVKPRFAFSGHHHYFNDVTNCQTRYISLARPSFNYVLLEIKGRCIHYQEKLTPPSDFEDFRNGIIKRGIYAKPCATPPILERITRILQSNSFYLYDSFSVNEEDPKLIILGEIHNQETTNPEHPSNTKLIGTALRELVKPVDTILSEGKSRFIFPSLRLQYHPRAGLPHYMDPTLFEFLKNIGAKVLQMEYKHADTFSRKLTRLSANWISQPLKHGAWQGFFESFLNRENYFCRVFTDEARSSPRIYGVLGMGHLIYPALRHYLQSNKISYAAFLPTKFNPKLIV